MPQIPLIFPPSRDFMPAKRKLIFRGRRSTPWGRLLPSGRKNFVPEIWLEIFRGRHSTPLGRLRPSGRKNFMSEIGFIFSRHRNKWTFRYFNENNCRNICMIQKNIVPLHLDAKHGKGSDLRKRKNTTF